MCASPVSFLLDVTLFSLANKNHALVKFAAKKLEFLTIEDSLYYDTLKKECNTEESKLAIKTQLQRAERTFFHRTQNFSHYSLLGVCAQELAL